jgi:hypothetical protein
MPKFAQAHSFDESKTGIDIPSANRSNQHTGVEIQLTRDGKTIPVLLHHSMKLATEPGDQSMTKSAIRKYYETHWSSMFNDSIKLAQGDASIRAGGYALKHMEKDHFRAQEVERLIHSTNKDGVLTHKEQSASLFPIKLSETEIVTLLKEAMTSNDIQIIVSNRDPAVLNIHSKINNQVLAPGVTEVRITIDKDRGVVTMTPNSGPGILTAVLIPTDTAPLATGTVVPVIKEVKPENIEQYKVVYTRKVTDKKRFFINETGPESREGNK